MAVRQYIGARYVPRFTGLFDITQSYEALDVVDNGTGTSYIAKIPTPAGTPLTDTDHWFLYGSTSGAIVNLQQQINDMKDGTVPGSLQDQIDTNTSDITALATTTKKKSPSEQHILIFGDSFSDDDPTDFAYIIRDSGIFKQVDLSVGGGRGFTGKEGAPGSGTTGVTLEWLTYLKNYVNSHTQEEIDNVDAVYIIGGFNDHYSTISVIERHMSEFFTYAHEHLPCDYYLIECGWCCDQKYITTPQGTFASENIRADIANKVIPTYAKSGKYGCAYLGNTVQALHDYENDWEDPTGSPYHPSTSGSINLANCIMSMMLGGTYCRSAGLQEWQLRTTATAGEYDTLVLGTVRIYEDMLVINAWGRRLFAYVETNATANSDAILDSRPASATPRFIASRYGGPKSYIPCQIIMPDDSRYTSVYYIDDDGKIHIIAPTAITTTDRIRFEPLSMTLSILDC